MYCIHCGTPLPDGVKFCPNCGNKVLGTEQPERKITYVSARCPICGGTLEVDPGQEAAVCGHCGAPFIVQDGINRYKYVDNRTINNTDNRTDNSIDESVRDSTSVLNSSNVNIDKRKRRTNLWDVCIKDIERLREQERKETPAQKFWSKILALILCFLMFCILVYLLREQMHGV